MDGLQSASAYNLTDASFPTNMEDLRPKVFPDRYGKIHTIHGEPLAFAPEIDWNMKDNLAIGNGPAESSAGAISQKSFPLDQGLSSHTVDPITLWSDYSDNFKETGSPDPFERDAASQSLWTSSNKRACGSTDRNSNSTSPPLNLNLDTTPSLPAEQPKHTRSDRARHAANQRHKKSKDARKDSHHSEIGSEEPIDSQESKASNKQLKLREKNKVAAAKCRSRQRKQVQNIESKCNHLSAANGELKKQIRDLSGELNDLRSLALNHQTCNCQIAMYNYHQAKKVVADLQASNMERNTMQMLET